MITYTKPEYTTISTDFQLAVDSTHVFVEKFMDYHYAHFSYSGIEMLIVTACESITSYDISPHSLNITGTVKGNQLFFKIDSESKKPNYLIVQINNMEKLVILADILEINPPALSGTGIFNIGNAPYSADNTFSRDITKILQQAIDDAVAIGGGIVYVPVGVYKVKDILYMKSNVTLYLQGGAIIKSNPDRNLYTNRTARGGKIFIEPMLRIDNAHNVKILGRGILDGSGIDIMDKDTSSSSYLGYRRNIIAGKASNNISIEGIIIKDSTTWTINGIEGGDGFTVRNIKIINHKNADIYKIMNDGINICGSRNAVVEKNFVMTVDDALCAKSSVTDFEMYNIHFRNNIVFSSCAGLKAGMQSHSAMYDVWFENNDVVQARRGIVTEATTGNELMSDIHFINTRVEHFVNTIIGKSTPIEIIAGTAPVSDVHVDNAVFEKLAVNKINIYGSSDIINVRNVELKNIYLCSNSALNTCDEEVTMDCHVDGITVIG
jgi:polygalacturonase